MRRKSVLVPLLVLLVLPGLLPLVAPQPAAAQTIVLDPANLGQNTATRIQTWTAILQRITQILNQIRQITNQIEMLRLQYQNLVRLGEDVAPILTEIRGLVAAYQSLLREGRALVYTLDGIDRRFREIFNPFPVNIAWRDAQLIRSETSLDTYRAILKANAEFGRKAVQTQERNEDLMAQALGTEGNLEALHAQALIQAHTAQEVSKTVEQLASLNNILAVHFANEISTRESLERSFDEWLAPSALAAPYESYPRLDALPEMGPQPTREATP